MASSFPVRLCSSSSPPPQTSIHLCLSLFRMENDSPGDPSAARSSDSAELTLSPTPKFLETESMSTEWTDEKHSLYLKSIEASFVNQLYDSLDCHLQHKQSSSSSRTLCKDTRSPSGQFKVLRDGFWHEIKFSRPGFQRNEVNGCQCFLTSPWIKHFRSAPKLQVYEAVSLNGKGTTLSASAADVDKPSQCWSHVKSGEINVNAALEISDQNFVNEDEEGEEADQSSMNVAKRMKIVEGGSSSADQVVPFGRSPLNDAPQACASPGG